jgi:hypothetical protein
MTRAITAVNPGNAQHYKSEALLRALVSRSLDALRQGDKMGGVEQ